MCRTGCKTKDCGSYAQCLRNSQTQMGPMWTNSKAVHSELDSYASARKQGIQPASTSSRDIENAVRLSDATGRAYDASTGSFK